MKLLHWIVESNNYFTAYRTLLRWQRFFCNPKWVRKTLKPAEHRSSERGRDRERERERDFPPRSPFLLNNVRFPRVGLIDLPRLSCLSVRFFIRAQFFRPMCPLHLIHHFLLLIPCGGEITRATCAPDDTDIGLA